MRHRAGGCGAPGSPTHRGSGREARRAHPPGRGAGGTCEPSCSSLGRSAALSACTPHLRGGPVGTVRRDDRTAPLRVFEPRPEVTIHCPGLEVRVHVELLNATLFRDRVFGGVTDREMRSLRVRVGPRSNSPSTLVGRGISGRRDTGAQRAQRGGRAEVGALQLEAQGRRRPLEGRRGVRPRLPQTLQGALTVPTPRFWFSGLQNPERTHFCCCKPPGSWDFVMAAVHPKLSC